METCRELNRCMRIGTNHGSLSARILAFYGDSPRGMVESAVECAAKWKTVGRPSSSGGARLVMATSQLQFGDLLLH